MPLYLLDPLRFKNELSILTTVSIFTINDDITLRTELRDKYPKRVLPGEKFID